MVTAGEQQPESDHNYRGKKSTTGIWQERHFRSAEDWFSYQLKNPDGAGRKIKITYWGAEKNRKYDIYINNRLLKTINADGSGGNAFIDAEYDLPAELIEKKHDVLEIKFKAHPHSATAGIYAVRLLTQ